MFLYQMVLCRDPVSPKQERSKGERRVIRWGNLLGSQGQPRECGAQRGFRSLDPEVYRRTSSLRERISIAKRPWNRGESRRHWIRLARPVVSQGNAGQRSGLSLPEAPSSGEEETLVVSPHTRSLS